MKIMITGATGVIGRSVVKELCSNDMYELYTCSQTKFVWNCDNITHLCLNLLDENQIAEAIYDIRPDYIIHLAWGRFGSKTNDMPDHIQWLKSGISIAEKFAEIGGKRFIGCGTMSEYSPGNYERVEYVSPTEPVNLYGNCKLALFHAIKSIAKVNNFSFLWARLPYVIGKGVTRGSIFGDALTAISEKKKFCLGLSDNCYFDLIDADDLGRLFNIFLKNEAEGLINFSSGNTVNVKSFIKKMFIESDCLDLFEVNCTNNSSQVRKMSNKRLFSFLDGSFVFKNPYNKILYYLNNQ